MYTYLFASVCVYLYIYIYVYVCKHACMYECIYTCMHACRNAGFLWNACAGLGDPMARSKWHMNMYNIYMYVYEYIYQGGTVLGQPCPCQL